MKKVLTVILLFTVIAFSACKKKDVSIVGKWNIVSAVSNNHYSGSDHIETEPGVAGDYVTFNSNGTYNSHASGSDDAGTYSVTGSTLVLDNDETFAIKTLTASSLVLYEKENLSGADTYFELTYTFNR